MDFINPLVFALNGAVGDQLGQRITRGDTALPLLALFIQADLVGVEFGCIDAMQSKFSPVTCERITVCNDAVGSPNRTCQNQTKPAIQPRMRPPNVTARNPVKVTRGSFHGH